MTVVRRELPLSKSASRPGRKTERRIVSARTLQSCPPRAVVDAARESHTHLRSFSLCFVLNAYATGSRLSRPVIAAQMKPTSSRAIAATATGGRLPCPMRWR